jgi:hypothetical protein
LWGFVSKCCRTCGRRTRIRGDRREITYADQMNDRDISCEITNTRLVPIKNSMVMNMWDDMEQFESRGELLVEVQDKFLNGEKNTMGGRIT